MDERATGQPIRFEHYRVSTDEQGRPLKLGEGAMGVTYLAEDTNLKVRVALKVIRPQLLGDAEVGQRFQREAQAAARLRHPNVAGVYHLGMVDNTFFYAMEFVEGETVKDRVQRNGPLPLKEALEVALQVCEALGAAEKHKMVHRDIKPANIMLEAIEDDLLRVKLIDFGLAKPLHAEAQNSMALQTQAGIFLGTPVFASPEQIQDVPPDSRADFYSLGLTLWFMLEGRTPFEGSLHKVLFDQVHTAPPLGRLLWVPAEIRDLLGKMLEKDPVNRPQTARELRQKIHDCLRALATSGTSYSEWQQRFQVEGKPRSQPWGMIYEGQDTLSGAVRLHLLRNDRFSDPKAIQGVLGDARRAIDIHHPNILRHLTVFPTSGAQGTGWMVVTEHPGNQTLLDHLRKVKQLPPTEAIAIIERLASAIDTCIANDLITADLDPAGIFLKQVPRTEIHALTQTATATASVLSASAAETFEVVPKLSPINYSYLTTLRPADETAIGMTQGPFRAEATTPQELVQRLALLAYQCLGGAVGGAWSRVPRFIPLASLTQKQNDTLRTALVDSTWMRATDFVEAFQQTRTTRRSDETSRISTSTEATVMLTSWRMLADLAAGDSGEFSTEHAKEFTGKIEKQEVAPAPAPAPEESITSEAESAHPSEAESESIVETQETPVADTEKGVSEATASVLDSTLTTERTQTWGRTEEPAESPAAEATETIADSIVEPPPANLKQLSPDEAETLTLSTGVNEMLVTAAPPEIKEDAGAGTVAQVSTVSVMGDSAAAESEQKTETKELPTEEDVAASEHLAPSSVTAEAPATDAPSEGPSTAEVEGKEASAPATTLTHIPSPEVAQKQEQQPLPQPSASKVSARAPTIAAPSTESVGASASLRPIASLPASPSKAPASTAISAVPVPPPARPPQVKAPSAPRKLGARLESLPRWVLPAAAVLAALVLIAGVTSLMSDDVADPVVAEDPIHVPPEPPVPPPPAPPGISELLTAASAAATAGDIAKLDETLAKIRAQFPDQSWESDPAVAAFREGLYRAYREKKLGDGAAALRKYHDIFVAATFARVPDFALLRQISSDLSSPADATLAEPFEKALLNSLAADESRTKERMDEALAYIKKRPDSVVAEIARGILSAELKESVDYLEQVPRDTSQAEYLKNALTALMPRMQELAEAGVPEAYYILGDKAYKEKRLADAERNFEAAADLNHAPSMRRYGNAMTNQVGNRAPDFSSAAYYLRLASAQNDSKAKLILADVYLPQTPTIKRPWNGKEAEQLLKEAMEVGLAGADYLYGAILLEFEPDHPAQPFAPGLTGRERKIRAVEHLKKAVAGDVPQAYPALAVALLNNADGKKDIAGAKEALEKGSALKPKNPFCMYLLSVLISGNHSNTRGIRVTADDLAAAGILADPVRSEKLRMEAIDLFREAARNHEVDAIQWCKANNIPY